MGFTSQGMERTFHKQTFHILRNGWMDCRDVFHAALCLYHCLMGQIYVAEYEVY